MNGSLICLHYCWSMDSLHKGSVMQIINSCEIWVKPIAAKIRQSTNHVPISRIVYTPR